MTDRWDRVVPPGPIRSGDAMDRERRVRAIQQRLDKGQKVPYYGLIDPATGDLVSTGTEAMFEGGQRPIENTYAGYDIIDFGQQGPNFAQKVWDRAGRRLLDRPAPVIVSRLDDIEQWLINDPEFSVVWGALSATRKQQVRNGLRRVMGQILGAQQFRGESDPVEL